MEDQRPTADFCFWVCSASSEKDSKNRRDQSGDNCSTRVKWGWPGWQEQQEQEKMFGVFLRYKINSKKLTAICFQQEGKAEEIFLYMQSERDSQKT